jgi:lysophospholipase L1-like esterase
MQQEFMERFAPLKTLGLYIKNALLVSGITILLVIGVELLSHLLLSIRYAVAARQGALIDPRSRADGYGNAEWAVEYFNEANSMPLYTWHSYVYWRATPFKGKYTNIDEEGIRHTWNGTNKEESTKSFRIFMFGGSTMWGSGARDEETIPSFLAKTLRECGLSAEVTNFGIGGYITTQEVISLLRELQRRNMPDLVVFYDGANDVFSTFQNKGMAGIPQNEYNRQREFNLLRPEMIRRLQKEALLETFLNSSTYQILRSLLRRVTGRDLLHVEWNPSVYPPLNQVASEVVRVYDWNITLVRTLGQAYGFKTLFYWQPIVSTKDKPTQYEQEIAQGVSLGDYYEATTTMLKAQLSEVDTFHDISRVFNGDPKPYFVDTVHMTGGGNEIVARRMLKEVVPMVQLGRMRKSWISTASKNIHPKALTPYVDAVP